MCHIRYKSINAHVIALATYRKSIPSFLSINIMLKTTMFSLCALIYRNLLLLFRVIAFSMILKRLLYFSVLLCLRKTCLKHLIEWMNSFIMIFEWARVQCFIVERVEKIVILQILRMNMMIHQYHKIWIVKNCWTVDPCHE